MKQILITFMLCLLISSFTFIRSAQCCFSEIEIKNLNSEKAENIFSILEKSSKDVRDKYFHCKVGIYELAENVIKSEALTEVQKLVFYYRILLLYPNNAELGSVLGYDTIKLFMKYKKQPIEQTVDSIKDLKIRKYIKKSLIDADMLEGKI
ncbi:MAG: hypothetical protein GY804_00810 [Alphaproteobacteria bacterium]|nr:hypothetical protein [Alphaproteobacteria bacterium]